MLIVTIIGFILGRDYSLHGWIGLLTGITVVINLILVGQGRLTNYSWGIIACAAWLTTAITNRLIGDIASQSFYLIMQFVGITVWHRKMAAQPDASELTGRKLSKLAGCAWFALAVSSTPLSYTLVNNLTVTKSTWTRPCYHLGLSVVSSWSTVIVPNGLRGSHST